MLATWRSELEESEQKDHPLTRLVAHMEWGLAEREGVSDLLEYEARFNLLPYRRDPVVCTYDLTRYGGAFIVDVTHTHPLIILGGILQENPFYAPPEEFVRELRENGRRSSGGV